MCCRWAASELLKTLSLFCNLDSFLHLLLPPTRFWCQFWHIWKPFRPPFENQCGVPVAHPKNLTRLDFPLLSTNCETWGNPYPTGSFFAGWKGWKGLSEALWLVQRFLPDESLHRHSQSEVPLGNPAVTGKSRGGIRPADHTQFFTRWVREAAAVIRVTLATYGLLWQVGAGRVQRWQASISPWELSVPSWGLNAVLPQQDWTGRGRVGFFF